MSDRVQQAFSLDFEPFGKEVRGDQLLQDAMRQQALERLVNTVAHRQHALVLGESGVGKTCVTWALKEGLSPVHYRVEYVVHVTLAPRDFYRQLCYAMSIEPKATPRPCSRRSSAGASSARASIASTPWWCSTRPT